MNYIQIKIGGKLRGLKFNQFTDVEYQVKLGKQTNPVAHTYSMVWAALVSNCIVKCEEVDFTFEDVCDWCEKVSESDFKLILETWKKTKEFLKDIPEDKKKVVEKRSVRKITRRNVLK